MGAALALAERGRGRTAPNPTVGCVIVQPAPAKAGGCVVGRGWTQPGGRPHAEAMALAQAGDAARGATVYTTLEPCAHASERGPACSDLLVAAGVARVVAAIADPDPRTDGRGHQRLRDAGIAVEIGVGADAAQRSMAGFLTRRAAGRPFVTLKLATSLDGCIARADGESKWITGVAARAHAHIERARHEAILVGRGTVEADAPTLDVRIAGLADRSPRRLVLSTRPAHDFSRHPRESGGPSPAPSSSRHGEAMGPRFRGDDESWETIPSPHAIAALDRVDHLLVEGGAQTAAAFLAADLVDRLLLYRAPIVIGGGRPAIGDIGLGALGEAHGRWRLRDRRMLGIDSVEEYERVRN
ncbi:MAG: bifunctional diaminohydroxyphosphoribosylaminopyrimidine deaminase/5-amino-6-(5-phosphoribosylamino)uracil reductase RibD [Sphingomonas sp.]|uniref:bifunctional diaminohydroxyphosphoribosylaminopyrimidine deaminase/5-amino-6-(5-phosphoribosylamino)uracil reductase RibD n=1 Tax=Sphingomonas sp. TaxID=28214 RepID=UPI001AC4B57B|nr:bifunctional diaminohydroxyphosphoribosylaminopyrimidine deaminase/5-amino-6-(5-phosphoribosylamino)uracil reductase RibD [Sphingomonas sp.]MBN8808805.1 bifunctional diaminohydroxyphosphoribosylaminopyrimidine deaminase/5-amino-6-(5-phosphoribosylamino)uracil reductase RibD [Sphingomonas sp.]